MPERSATLLVAHHTIMAELWTLSGINSFDPIEGGLADYVATATETAVGRLPTRSIHSALGTTPNYGNEHRLPILTSPLEVERILDIEARELARTNVAKGGFAGLEIRCLLTGPKTTTLPPQAESLLVEIYWSPDDRVPNQGIFKRNDLRSWEDYLRGTGSLWPIRNRSGRGFGHGHGFPGFIAENPKI